MTVAFSKAWNKCPESLRHLDWKNYMEDQLFRQAKLFQGFAAALRYPYYVMIYCLCEKDLETAVTQSQIVKLRRKLWHTMSKNISETHW